ncbi:hypothetical protein K504DRAFT_468167 [Pleomassaria siparia CBS 279.74]|uniref:Uncharacterized protein n=1 Tax=Pleomassaria siparia CBS 279.74 TaxID=1314801 RepID=A0A6G1K8J5_9PLEO|nr:hypothetical protein K504DRAFT_468167 [Pleomassaria siparia CBS 279.74]
MGACALEAANRRSQRGARLASPDDLSLSFFLFSPSKPRQVRPDSTKHRSHSWLAALNLAYPPPPPPPPTKAPPNKRTRPSDDNNGQHETRHCCDHLLAPA